MADFFIDAALLAEHQAISREERLQAQALRDAVRMLGQADSVAVDDRYRLLLRKVNQLNDFVRGMNRALDLMDEETGQMFRRIRKITGDAAESAQEVSRSFIK